MIESALLRASWIAYYKNQDYRKASQYYKKLYDVASYKENSFVAMKGMLRTSYFLNDFKDVLTNADRILKSDLVTNEELIEANYYAGKAYLQLDDIDKSFEAFSKTAKLTTNEFGIEARFLMADILYQQGKYNEAKTQCNQIINELPTYEVWVVRSYILLADIAAAKGEFAQAKATLKSVINNYQGDAELVELAKLKLKQVEEVEKRSGVSPSDINSDGLEEINFNN